MNQTNNTIQFSQFAAVSKDSDEVLGKILYYTLSSILIDREVLARLCDTVDFPYNRYLHRYDKEWLEKHPRQEPQSPAR